MIHKCNVSHAICTSRTLKKNALRIDRSRLNALRESALCPARSHFEHVQYSYTRIHMQRSSCVARDDAALALNLRRAVPRRFAVLLAKRRVMITQNNATTPSVHRS